MYLEFHLQCFGRMFVQAWMGTCVLDLMGFVCRGSRRLVMGMQEKMHGTGYRRTVSVEITNTLILFYVLFAVEEV